jgi:hypothetical protein
MLDIGQLFWLKPVISLLFPNRVNDKNESRQGNNLYKGLNQFTIVVTGLSRNETFLSPEIN